MFHFVLEEAGVFLQSLSEFGNVVADSQQLHRVAIVVPGWSYILTNYPESSVRDEEIKIEWKMINQTIRNFTASYWGPYLNHSKYWFNAVSSGEHEHWKKTKVSINNCCLQKLIFQDSNWEDVFILNFSRNIQRSGKETNVGLQTQKIQLKC